MNYQAASIFQKILMRLPEPLLYCLGWLLGCCMLLQGRRRRTAFKNIKTAFPEKSNREIYRILRRNFFYFGLSFIESFVAPRFYKYITTQGTVINPQEGGICVGIHAGSWELINSFFAQKYKYAVLVEPQKNRGLDDFLNKSRTKEGTRICLSAKDVLRCVKEKYFVGMVVDHGLEEKAPAINFFSHGVPTPRGAVYFARRCNKKIYPCFTHRDRYFYITFEIGPPIATDGKTDEAVLTEINEFYETRLRQYPWEYFWPYKRFKYKTNRDILVLSDGKPGHLKQSQALCAFLQDTSRYKIRLKVIQIRYRWQWMRMLADIFALFSPRHSTASWLWLGLVLDRKTRLALENIYADIVISTGSFIAAVNKLMSSYLGAKSACILRPNFPLSKFNLTIIPEHDRVQADNTIVIKGALTHPASNSKKIEECRDFFHLTPEKKIAVLVGGPLASEVEFFANFKIFIEAVLAFSRGKGYRVLVTTSRRTPELVASYLQQLGSERGVIEALVIANKQNYNFVLEGFIGLSDIVFVTGESISMVSEAASLSDSCVCVLLEPCDNKRKLFFDSIKDEIVVLNAPYDIAVIPIKPSGMFDKNKERITEQIGVLF